MRVQSRRTDPFPTTWEVPAGIGLIWLLGSFLALPAGQGIAYALNGRGFVWPGSQLGNDLMGLLTGAPGRGVPLGLQQVVPPNVLVYAVAVVIEGALAACALVALSWWWRTTGPYAQFGMAPRHEIAAVLGRGPLRRRRKTIRPDLAGGARR